jgi:hypothetical protein
LVVLVLKSEVDLLDALPTAASIDRLRGVCNVRGYTECRLTEENKATLRQLESERLQAALLFLPEALLAEVARSLTQGARPRFVDAQVAIAIDLLLVVPLRSQNLSSLDWGRHFYEPDGPRGRLMMHIPARETKGKQFAEIPAEVARRLRWYRRP